MSITGIVFGLIPFPLTHGQEHFTAAFIRILLRGESRRPMQRAAARNSMYESDRPYSQLVKIGSYRTCIEYRGLRETGRLIHVLRLYITSSFPSSRLGISISLHVSMQYCGIAYLVRPRRIIGAFGGSAAGLKRFRAHALLCFQ